MSFLAVIGAGGVAEGRPDAPKRSPRRSSGRQVLLGRVPLVASALVQPLGKRLREPVGERLGDDRAIVVVRGDNARRPRLGAVDGDREGPERVAVGRDEVGKTAIGAAVAVGGLLTQEGEAGVTDDDVVALRARRPEPVDPARREAAVAHDLRELGECVVVQFARGRILEDRRVASLEIPGVDEELPVDVGDLSSPIAGSRGRVPVKGATGRSSKLSCSRLARAPASDRSGRRCLAACWSRSRT